MDTNQQRVQASANHLNKAMFEFSNYLDTNGVKLDEKGKRFASVFDRETLVFLNQCSLYSSSVSVVMWNGKSTQIMGLLLSLNGFMKQVNHLNGYKFSSEEWFQR